MLDQVPAGSLLHRDMPPGAYEDCCVVPLGELAPLQMARLVPVFFQSAPAWFLRLFRLRNWIVSRLGLRTGDFPHEDLRPPFRVGDYVGVFRIIDISEEEIVFGEDDRHLDFRSSLLLRQGELVISTWVKEHNLLGRVYFTIVKPFHRLIVPIMARRTLAQLRAR